MHCVSKHCSKHCSKHHSNALCVKAPFKAPFKVPFKALFKALFKAPFKCTVCQSTIQSITMYQSTCVWLRIGGLCKRMTKLRSVLKKFKSHACTNLNSSSYKLESENI